MYPNVLGTIGYAYPARKNITCSFCIISFSQSEVLSYLYIPSSFQLFLSLFLLVIQLFAKEVVLDQIGRIKGPDPWKCHTSRCHLGYIYTGECVSPYYGMGANCMDVRQFLVDRARSPRKAVYLG